MTGRELDRVVDTGQIGGDHLVPMTVIEIVDLAIGIAVTIRSEEARAGIDTGIGEHHIDPAMASGHLIERD